MDDDGHGRRRRTSNHQPHDDLARRLVAELADPLLLALPGLEEVVVEVPGEPTRTLRDVGSRWHVHRVSGSHRGADLAFGRLVFEVFTGSGTQ